MINQSLITDNVTVAIELVHRMKFQTNGKMSDVVLKLNINKTYDMIDCHYLCDVMALSVRGNGCTKDIPYLPFCLSFVLKAFWYYHVG